MKYEQKIFGEYVATPIKNAFNSKTSYWLSKANCMVSVYMFTCENGYSEKEMFSDMNLATYIAMLEEKCKRAHDHVVYMEEYRAAKEYLKKLKKKEAAQKEEHNSLSETLQSLIGTEHHVSEFDAYIEKFLKNLGKGQFFHDCKPELIHDLATDRFVKCNYRCCMESMKYFICLRLDNDGECVRIEDGCLELI